MINTLMPEDTDLQDGISVAKKCIRNPYLLESILVVLNSPEYHECELIERLRSIDQPIIMYIAD